MNQKDAFISILVPVYNESENIKLFLDTIIPIVNQYQHEIIFIDDGSTDNTAKIIKSYIQKDKSVKLLSFSRNFGHQMALTAGYDIARGDCVVSIDVDLQDPPELIHEMIIKWQEGFHIVYAKRISREESFFKKFTASLFYHLINRLSDIPIPVEVGDYRLVDKKVVHILRNLPESSRFLRGLVAWSGFETTYVSFVRKPRKKGETHYPFSKMLAFALDGIISFSSKPLKIASFIGFATSFFGIAGILYALYQRIFLSPAYWVTGWTALFVAIMFFGGVQLITIGIIGEYIAKVYREVQRRPRYIIKETTNLK